MISIFHFLYIYPKVYPPENNLLNEVAILFANLIISIYIILFSKVGALFWSNVESLVMTGFKMISILVIDVQ